MDVFTASQRNDLLYTGISCAHRAGGAYRITAAISNYRENAGGNADDSYLYVETLATLRYVLRYLKSSIETKYPRSKLANDGTRFASGQAIVTPSIIRGELVASYLDLMELGLVENVDAFVENLVVERNSTNPNRLDVLYPPDLVNGLRIFALLMQFRQQYNTRSVA
jgi:phage tail sheath gpL-like